MLFITNRFPTLVAVVFFPFSPCEPFFFYSTSFTCMSKRFNIHYNKNNHVTKDKNYRISTGNKIFRANTALDWALSSDCYIRTSIFREKLFSSLKIECWFWKTDSNSKLKFLNHKKGLPFARKSPPSKKIETDKIQSLRFYHHFSFISLIRGTPCVFG